MFLLLGFIYVLLMESTQASALTWNFSSCTTKVRGRFVPKLARLLIAAIDVLQEQVLASLSNSGVQVGALLNATQGGGVQAGVVREILCRSSLLFGLTRARVGLHRVRRCSWVRSTIGKLPTAIATLAYSSKWRPITALQATWGKF